jgi:hypothetical protein
MCHAAAVAGRAGGIKHRRGGIRCWSRSGPIVHRLLCLARPVTSRFDCRGSNTGGGRPDPSAEMSPDDLVDPVTTRLPCRLRFEEAVADAADTILFSAIKNVDATGGADRDGPNLGTTGGGIEWSMTTRGRQREEGGGQGKNIGGGVGRQKGGLRGPPPSASKPAIYDFSGF